jgi:hypothetical protein
MLIFYSLKSATWTDYKTYTQIAKELKITPIFRQITGIQEKLDTTCK